MAIYKFQGMAKMYRKSMLKNGSIFTIDAILALLIAGTALVSSFILLTQTNENPFAVQDLATIAYDSLTVLEGSDTFFNAVKANSIGTITQFLNALPSQICGNISIYTDSNIQILSSNKANCDSTDYASIARGVFIANNTYIYYAEMKVWYR